MSVSEPGAGREPGSGGRSSRPSGHRSAAAVVAIGILLSRCMGLVRERVFAHYFGNSAAADAFKAALRIPNVLQNLFGEGALSASFIPVYSRLRATGNEDRSRLVAANVAALLLSVTAFITALGVLCAPWLVDVLAPGFASERRDLTVSLTRIFFPSVFLLVCSAWCLGVLNSHRRFFLPYASPVVWNSVIILGVVFLADSRGEEALAIGAAWCVVLGSAAQCAVQLPSVWRLLGGIRIRFRPLVSESREVVRNIGPVVLSRGVVQISAYMDSVIASLLPTGAVAALSYAQNIALMPISLFSLSISAAELPSLSELDAGSEGARIHLRDRLTAGLRRISILVVPSAVAFIVLGDFILQVLYETGRFTSRDTSVVWRVLVASGAGLLWSALARLCAATFFALRDTDTPFRCSLIRVITAIAVGACAALGAPRWFGLSEEWGLFGLTAASALAGCVEYSLLHRHLSSRIGSFTVGTRYLGILWSTAIGAAFLARIVGKSAFQPATGKITGGIATLALYGTLYLGILALLKLPEARGLIPRRFIPRRTLPKESASSPAETKTK